MAKRKTKRKPAKRKPAPKKPVKRKAPKKRKPAPKKPVKRKAPKKRKPAPKKPVKRKPVKRRPTKSSHDWTDLLATLAKGAALQLRNEGYDARGRAHLNADGSVDAEVTVMKPKTVKIEDVMLDIQSIDWRLAPWISAGVKAKANEDAGSIALQRGFSALTFYQRGKFAGEVFNIVEQKIIPAFRRKKASFASAHVRLNYNPADMPPGREGR